MARLLRYLALTLMIIWTVLLFMIFRLEVWQDEREARRIAVNHAQALYQQIVDFRQWNADHGGVYVLVDEDNPPNPFLTVPERDVVSQDGSLLTLVNPAYMTRQVSEISMRKRGAVIRITSLDPIRPANSPVPWEAEALRKFEQGRDLFVDATTDGSGRTHFRFMRPLIVEEACLGCHGSPGAILGGIRGGISVSFPLTSIIDEDASGRKFTQTVYFGIWVMGLILIAGLMFAFQIETVKVKE